MTIIGTLCVIVVALGLCATFLMIEKNTNRANFFKFKTDNPSYQVYSTIKNMFGTKLTLQSNSTGKVYWTNLLFDHDAQFVLDNQTWVNIDVLSVNNPTSELETYPPVVGNSGDGTKVNIDDSNTYLTEKEVDEMLEVFTKSKKPRKPKAKTKE